MRPAGRPLVVDQVVPNLHAGDAVSTCVLAVQRWLRGWGLDSVVFAFGVGRGYQGRARSCTAEALSARRPDLLILHYATASPVSAAVRESGLPLALVYHNVTPPEYFHGWNDVLAESVQRGRAELADFAPQAVAAAAFSAYSARDLCAAGYDSPAVLPFPFVPNTIAPDEPLLARLRDGGPALLFVGRLSPNKRHDHLLALFAWYQRRIAPDARLWLVGGGEALERYVAALRELAARLGVRGLALPGHVRPAELAAYYRAASIFVCLSAHEGFGVPLLEAMAAELPVVALAEAAVPETLGDAGVLARALDYALLAEVLDALVCDADLRACVLARQRRRLAAFAPGRVAEAWRGFVARAVAAALAP
ncbi:MAG: glycosyltransferase family 4 protein [Chloroflexi bacterium]|nr:glycosyltransferase family 4 protein [Chloroflexota bacterium]